MMNELNLLMERGGVRNGLARGMIPVVGLVAGKGLIDNGMPFKVPKPGNAESYNVYKSLFLMGSPVASAVLNPLFALQTMRNIVQPGEVQPSYL